MIDSPYMVPADWADLDDRYDPNYKPPAPKPGKTCKYCGKEGLRWKEEAGGKWRLYDDDKKHECWKKS